MNFLRSYKYFHECILKKLFGLKYIAFSVNLRIGKKTINILPLDRNSRRIQNTLEKSLGTDF